MARVHRRTNLTAERLREILHYDPETGVFTWAVRIARCVQQGWVAGGVSNFGYRIIRVDKITYVGHRLAWLYMTGEWPTDEIDHRNGIRDDNRWVNLREATAKQNRENRNKAPSNTSGVRGVTWDKARGKWHPLIKHHGKMIHLGRFDSFDDAVAARKNAEQQYFTHHREMV